MSNLVGLALSVFEPSRKLTKTIKADTNKALMGPTASTVPETLACVIKVYGSVFYGKISCLRIFSLRQCYKNIFRNLRTNLSVSYGQNATVKFHS